MSQPNGQVPEDRYVYTLLVIVDDEAALQRAAEARAALDGYDIAQWRADRKGPGTDLVLVLDPGAAPPGCRLEASNVDAV